MSIAWICPYAFAGYNDSVHATNALGSREDAKSLASSFNKMNWKYLFYIDHKKT